MSLLFTLVQIHKDHKCPCPFMFSRSNSAQLKRVGVTSGCDVLRKPKTVFLQSPLSSHIEATEFRRVKTKSKPKPAKVGLTLPWDFFLELTKPEF